MLWLCALAVSWLTRQSMQPQHQRQSLNQNEGVFVVFFYFLLVSDFDIIGISLLDLCFLLLDCAKRLMGLSQLLFIPIIMGNFAAIKLNKWKLYFGVRC